MDIELNWVEKQLRELEAQPPLERPAWWPNVTPDQILADPAVAKAFAETIHANTPPGWWPWVKEWIPKRRWNYCYVPAGYFGEHARFDGACLVISCYVRGPRRETYRQSFAMSELPNHYVTAVELEHILVYVKGFNTVRNFIFETGGRIVPTPLPQQGG